MERCLEKDTLTLKALCVHMILPITFIAKDNSIWRKRALSIKKDNLLTILEEESSKWWTLLRKNSTKKKSDFKE